MFTLLHNNSCSKSQCLYQYLADHQIPFETRDYIREPLSPRELTQLLQQLARPAAEILRTTDPAFDPFRQQTDTQDDAAVIELLSHHPGLLQRPILIHKTHAVIGRPLEQALEFIQQTASVSNPGR